MSSLREHVDANRWGYLVSFLAFVALGAISWALWSLDQRIDARASEVAESVHADQGVSRETIGKIESRLTRIETKLEAVGGTLDTQMSEIRQDMRAIIDLLRE